MSEPVLMSGATPAGRRRHYVQFFIDSRQFRTGSRGTPLCGGDTVFDQAWHDAEARRYGYRAPDVSGLPLCRRCEKRAALQEVGAT